MCLQERGESVCKKVEIQWFDMGIVPHICLTSTVRKTHKGYQAEIYYRQDKQGDNTQLRGMNIKLSEVSELTG